MLEFTDRRGLEREIERLRSRHKARIIPGHTAITRSIEDELRNNFAGQLRTFETPLAEFGSDFQKSIWQALRGVPFGTTSTYADLSIQVGKPGANRATGRANGDNQLAIIVPCHRILDADGALVGYGGGIERKQWLIEHEKRAAR
ncbi:MAG: methylated-DNA--[protein]-cysteine S-methyltransferase [Magnetovibrio sp.]|nr:methylated-DNA--[protein]-cysteine S-methyltransferase [Magnetovibrio sp.]